MQQQVPRPDHIVRTAHDWRAAPILSARIKNIKTENSTGSVKSFLFRLEDADKDPLEYRPGQWLDVWCPGVPTIGGFTLISAPQEKNETFELAIKASHHPPAKWFASEARLDDKVAVRVGGSFMYPPLRPVTHDSLVLLAGGVGLNPILSILTWLDQDPARRRYLKQIKLLYASKEAELAFANRLQPMQDFLDMTLYLSSTSSESQKQPFKMEKRRLNDHDVLEALSDMHQPLAYICGPPEMTDHLEGLLGRSRSLGGAGLDREHIQLEKWW